ncbi:MAG: hypothetical protein PF487_00565 [Bacteroidales bacterium]|jgi:hypothetical protein|nr:hypothetical protein [Bacteroidales bacterium]
MFYFLPYTKFEIISDKNKEVIINQFLSSVSIVNSFSNNTFIPPRTYHDFEGIILSKQLKIRRVIRYYYNAFLPVLSFKIIERNNNVSIIVKIKFYTFVNVLLILFFSINILTFSIDPFSIGFILFFYVVIIYMFNKEAQLLKDKFDEIIQMK